MDKIRDFYIHVEKSNRIWFWICLCFSITLIIAGFVCPPLGNIDSSVLGAVGEIFGFAALGTVIVAIHRGVDAKVTHGDTSIELNNPDNKEKEQS